MPPRKLLAAPSATPLSPRTDAVTELTDPGIDERNGQVVLVQRFSVTGPGPIVLRARLSVGLGERGREDEAPVGAGRPQVLGWATGLDEHMSETCVVGSPSEVELIVLPVPDTITEITVTGTRAEEVAAS